MQHTCLRLWNVRVQHTLRIERWLSIIHCCITSWLVYSNERVHPSISWLHCLSSTWNAFTSFVKLTLKINLWWWFALRAFFTFWWFSIGWLVALLILAWSTCSSLLWLELSFFFWDNLFLVGPARDCHAPTTARYASIDIISEKHWFPICFICSKLKPIPDRVKDGVKNDKVKYLKVN